MYPNERKILFVRVFLTILSIASIISTFAPVHIAFKEFKGESVLIWREEDGGYEYHLVSTISEWILTLSFCAYIGSIHWDFKDLRVEPIRIRFIKLDGQAYPPDPPTPLKYDDRGQPLSQSQNWI